MIPPAVFFALCYVGGSHGLLVDSVRLTLTTDEAVPTDVPARLFVPINGTAPHPGIVFAHGSGGLYRNDDPEDVIEENFRRWADMCIVRGWACIFVDSYTPRGGKDNADSVTVRPYDVYAAAAYLRSTELVDVDSTCISLVGWSHGGTTALSAMSTTDTHASALPFASAVAFYPGCGMDSAYGGISDSQYCPYNNMLILAASLDSLYTAGHCDTRVDLAAERCSTGEFTMNVYEGADHGYDQAEDGDVAIGKYTAEDVAARNQADDAAWTLMSACVAASPSGGATEGSSTTGTTAGEETTTSTASGTASTASGTTSTTSGATSTAGTASTASTASGTTSTASTASGTTSTASGTTSTSGPASTASGTATTSTATVATGGGARAHVHALFLCLPGLLVLLLC